MRTIKKIVLYVIIMVLHITEVFCFSPPRKKITIEEQCEIEKVINDYYKYVEIISTEEDIASLFYKNEIYINTWDTYKAQNKFRDYANLIVSFYDLKENQNEYGKVLQKDIDAIEFYKVIYDFPVGNIFQVDVKTHYAERDAIERFFILKETYKIFTIKIGYYKNAF